MQRRLVVKLVIKLNVCIFHTVRLLDTKKIFLTNENMNVSEKFVVNTRPCMYYR